MSFQSVDAPLVSVIMPVYNHARYVAEALRSIVAQDWRPLEIIAIDDGSTDESLMVLEQAIAAVPPQEGLSIRVTGRSNQGAHSTINEGLDQAGGEYLAILNSDDFYLPSRIRRCVEAARRHHARMVITYVNPIDDDGDPLPAEHPWVNWYADVKMQELDLSPSLSALLLRYNIGVSTGNFVFHRSLLKDVGEFSNYRYAHDLDFLLRASLLEEPVLIREKLYGYRVHSSNTIKENNDRVTAEAAEIVRCYLARTFVQAPANPLAPRFSDDCYSLAGVPWPKHLEMAVDSLMYDPDVLSRQESGSTESRALVRAPDAAQARTHITLISHELSRTGAPVLLRDVASALHSSGVRSHVISLGAGPLVDDYQSMNSPVSTEGRLSQALTQGSSFLLDLVADRRVPSIAKRPLRMAAWLAGGVGARLRLWHYRARASGRGTLLVNSFASWPIALPLLERWQGAAFWYIHETYEPGLTMRSGRSQARLAALAKGGKVTFLFGSEATRAKWASEGLDGEVFYWSGLDAVSLAGAQSHPVDLTQSASPAAKRTILSVQSTGPRKGTRSLIEAFAYARRKGLIPHDVDLHIIGAHPPSRNALSRDLLCRIMEPDLRGHVQLIPNLSPGALEDHYRSAAVYVQSSTMECLPLALLNAMAHNLPIVSTDADGCREAIIEGKTGLLVPSRQPELLAKALSQLLADPARAALLGAAAGELFTEKFSRGATAPKLIKRLVG
ncbi:glycosyltransferase [Devosia naphthalenivorans]|uniref:glycosyltransferase n=1 Tax=Devosia naphthalenivorans TaxID=2082392 RepID=UPI000D3D7A05|nr:glycosyltransferase [Devosia naphthalenivorans]